MDQRIRLGVSACVVGEAVRYDGGHKRSDFVTEALGRHFDFVPLCPEVAIGLGTPRPTLRLIASDRGTRVCGSSDSSRDVTDALTDYAAARAAELDGISGYIFCAKSPSCGMERVPVYAENGHSLGKIGVGAYAAELKRRLPLLPMEENGRLQDPLLRENFVLRVVAYHRWQQLMQQGLSAVALQDYHRRHKFLLLAHDQASYRQLGPLLDGSGDLAARAQRYIEGFMTALARPASRGNHVNALMHMQGFLKQQLSAEEKRLFVELLERYRQGQAPLMAVIEMLRLFIQRHRVSYLLDQYYLRPYPDDLALRYGL